MIEPLNTPFLDPEDDESYELVCSSNFIYAWYLTWLPSLWQKKTGNRVMPKELCENSSVKGFNKAGDFVFSGFIKSEFVQHQLVILDLLLVWPLLPIYPALKRTRRFYYRQRTIRGHCLPLRLEGNLYKCWRGGGKNRSLGNTMCDMKWRRLA